jgi:exopolyphosphatase/guanosine-5'-triphosphate,3'-diphosphate pyrophosphatase
MHDVGMLISYPRHHQHSYYLIKNGDLRGFHPDEIEVIALIARYHRRGAPKRSHDEYAQLPGTLRRVVRILSSILHIAESLDRSHAQVISGIELRDRGNDLLLQVQAAGDAELELWAALRHAEPLAKAVGKPVQIELAGDAARPRPRSEATPRRRSRARPGRRSVTQI